MSELTLQPTPAAEGEVRLRLEGELDLATLGEARGAIALLEAQQPRRIVLDLRPLELIDSSGLRLLVEAERRAREEGRELVVAATPGGPVRKLLTLTLLAGRIPVVDDPDQPVPPRKDDEPSA